MSAVHVYDSDPSELPYSVGTLKETCTVRIEKGNYSTVLRLTVDEAVVLHEKLAKWLRT